MDFTLKDGQTLSICEATPADADMLLPFVQQVGSETDNLLFGKGEFTMTTEQERDFLKNMQENPNAFMFIGRIGDEIVSTSQVARVGTRARIAHRGSVAISVKKACWGMGIGTVVMRHLVQTARDMDIELLELEVRADNAAAVHLYEKTGFRQTGTHPHYFKFDYGYRDAVMMQMAL